MNHFLFIIPLTPSKLLNNERRFLQKQCLLNLLSQKYKRWQAILVGDEAQELSLQSNYFLPLNFEGKKEEKLQQATDYILTKNIVSNYIIRLDDDDFFNPNILTKIHSLDFDLYVDKQQYFWHLESNCISHRTWHWFPNTCIHKTSHALSTWGSFAKGSFEKFHNKALLIENDHSQLHPFYKDKDIIFAGKKDPVYLRTITSSSITAMAAGDFKKYLNSFGNWKRKNLKNYNLPIKLDNQKIHQPLLVKFYNFKNELIAKKNYSRHLNIAH